MWMKENASIAWLMNTVAFFKAMKELRERYLKEGKDDGQNT